MNQMGVCRSWGVMSGSFVAGVAGTRYAASVGRSGRSNQRGRLRCPGPGAERVRTIHCLYARCASSVSTSMSP